ncbi:MAG: exonuclease domain-containing protein [Candidatus Magasanikbacteria bacterium]
MLTPMNLLFFDTETTDLDDARLVQLAYKNTSTEEELCEYFKPPIPISFGSMAIHHITNEMVEDKSAFKGSEAHKKLLSNLESAIAVAHNALFDIRVLKHEGVEITNYIDTLRVSRHVIDAEQYTLQFLRYFLDLGVDAVAHDAAGDVAVLEALFFHLFSVVESEFALQNQEAVVDKLLYLTNTPVLLETFVFGKYKGRTFKEIGEEDQSYLQWLHGSETQKKSSDQNEDLVYTLQHYLT